MKEENRPAAPRQLAMVLDAPALEGLGTAERAQAVRLLAQLLLEAIGVVDEEDGDEEV
jgi:hypothetical protein